MTIFQAKRSSKTWKKPFKRTYKNLSKEVIVDTFVSLDKVAYLCDLSESGVIRCAGTSARFFLQTMYAGAMDKLREPLDCSQGPLLNAEAQVVDIVDVIFTGGNEFLLRTSEENNEEVFEWLSAHAQIEDDKGRVFEDLTLEEQNSHIATLLMFGPGAPEVYSKLLMACSDKVPVIPVALQEGAYGVPKGKGFLIFAPLNAASEIGNFLTEMLQVEVLDYEEYIEMCVRNDVRDKNLYGAEYVTATQCGAAQKLMRTPHDFVGGSHL